MVALIEGFVFDLVESAAPEVTFTFDQIIEALSSGLDDPVIERPRVYQAVSAANKTLLRERKRYLGVVRGLGYRVIRANEHVSVALRRKDRAQNQFARGLDVLRSVRITELNDNERRMHEGQLMILGSLYQAIRESELRHNRSEVLIAELTQRVDRLEKQEDDYND